MTRLLAIFAILFTLSLAQGCDECQTVLAAVNSRIHRDMSSRQIYTIIHDVCSGPQYADMCEEHVSRYINTIADLFASGYIPNQICRMIGKC
ncbi:hypothetical protein P9112_000931 [Eukaryota sp. TZLM1-RC]